MDNKEETRRFESEMMALPPLKMVLVNMEKQRADNPVKKSVGSNKSRKGIENQAAVVRLIDHLNHEEEK